MHARTRTTLCSAVAVGLAALPASGQSQWSQFRGPDGRGLAGDEEALPVEFGPDRNVVWKVAVSEGHSSPCIWGDRIFLTGHADGELETLCIDRTKGGVLWRRAVPAEEMERLHEQNSPASPTAATDGERVYVFFGAYGLLCYDFEGEEQWERRTALPKNTFGTAASPMIAGDYLIQCFDSNTQSYLEAIDGATGETVWKTERPGFKSGWSTPVLWQNDGTDELLVMGVWWLTAYGLEDGSERWSVPGLTDEPITMPATGEGLVFATSYNMKSNAEVIGLPEFAALLEECDDDGDGQIDRKEADKNESVLSRFDADGEGDHPLRIFFRFLDEDRDGKITEKEWGKLSRWLADMKQENAVLAIRPGDGDERPAEIVWQHGRGVPECPSPLYYDGRLYAVKNGGIATCLDARTGELVFEGRIGARGPRYASPVAGDGKIYAASARGVVTVLAAGDELRVLASNDLGERIMATPALMAGRIYVRTNQHLYAFGRPEQAPR